MPHAAITLNSSILDTMASARAGVMGTLSIPAQRLHSRRIDTPTVTAIAADYDRAVPVVTDWYAEDVHFFDMTLDARAASARGCFVDQFTDCRRFGKIFLAPAGHRLHAEGTEGHQHNLYVFLRAHPGFADETELGADLGSGLAPMLSECLGLRNERVGEALARIGREVAEPGFASELLVEGLGLMALAEAARSLRAIGISTVRKGGLPAWRMKLIEERIRDGDPLPTIIELAGLCGLSRRQLMRAFVQETGRSIGAHVQTLTIERAKALLTATDRQICDIAHDAGFANSAAFATAFRRVTGEAPRCYRNRHRARLPQ